MLAGCAVAVAASEWLHATAAPWAWAAALAGLAAVALVLTHDGRAVAHAAGQLARGLTGMVRHLPGRRPEAGSELRAALAAARPVAAPAAAALVCLALGAVLVTGVRQVQQIDCCWSALREERITAASRELAAALAGAVAEARRLAERGRTAGSLPPEGAFAQLREAIRSGGPAAEAERGVVILSPDGDPLAWAGRHRFVSARDTAELRAVITPFYVALEARRQHGAAVGSVLLDAVPAAPDRARAVSALFERDHGVALRFYPPRTAPHDPDVFDYAEPSGGGADTLFSVQPVPPSQGNARLAALHTTAERAGVALGLGLVLLFATAPPGRWRWLVVVVAAWCLARAPRGPALQLAGVFSPATFYRSLLGVFSASAGALTVLGIVLILAASVLWRRGLARRWANWAAAGLLVLVAPYLVRYFGRGIAPPAGGVGFALWMSWEVAVATAAMALILTAAALVRGARTPERVPWTVPAACAWATLAAIAGLWLWRPYGAWPEWYTFVWLPALVGVLVPAPRRWALAGIATVAGTAAALVTWGAAVEGRLGLAARDADGLGNVSDPRAVALLEQLGGEPPATPPRTAGALYVWWRASPIAAEDYPASLALWTHEGELEAAIRLASVDLPRPLLAALVRSPAATHAPRVERFERVPGVHYVLVVPLATGEVLTVGVGPRTRLIPADRVARFLGGEVGVAPPYSISLTLPSPGPTETVPAVWTRTAWSVRGEGRVVLPDGVRHVHLRVDLRSPGALFVRGALVVGADAVVLAACWILSLLLAEGWRPRLPSLTAALRSSYRVRLAATLSGFVVLPVLLFAVWSFARLGDEARRAGDLLIRQTLRDAAGTAGLLVADRPTVVAGSIVDLGTQLDADLWLYRAGVLTATSSPVLSELGLVDPLLPSDVFVRLALEDELEFSADHRTAGRSVLIGYRVVLGGLPSAQAILAVPQLLDDERVRQQEEDLGLALILGTLVGLVAAVSLAGLAARALARPVAALRAAAVAVGRGAPAPPFPPGGPREFEPVMSAFERMAADVKKSQTALEEARHRTAQVLANVATGVIAVDEGLRVAMANPRAAELLGAPLEPGDLLASAAPAGWLPVWNAVAAFLAGGGAKIAEHEFDIDGRQIRVQLASLGPTPDGCVVALDDATALTRAARVLAWGEMARQVAHEIKNPLTPIRLGIQHLQRARAKEGATLSFDAALEETAERILAEIDRLDAIARAFSRFASPAAEAAPLQPVDLLATAREVVRLYALGGTEAATRFEVAGEGGPPALARADEVKEVLVNLLENARNAGARRVSVRVDQGGRRLTVADDGRGIAHDALPRLFDPTFSTTSSGAGLGLAIARRLVESWGGTITLKSAPGEGTSVTITLPGTPERAA
ncbi:MAG TPA: ATP-binding protein [Gemmatimonadales bacterium]|nr:ATP-binding protein [Gemmatimonadales bacterium]